MIELSTRSSTRPSTRPSTRSSAFSSTRRSGRSQRGFTLLEVLVALTITGMVLGGLFSVAAGSKQLAYRSGKSLFVAIQERAVVNFALLQNEYRDVEEIIQDDRFRIRGNEPLDPVPRKTQGSRVRLQSFEVIDTETGEMIEGTRWNQLELPE